MKIKIVQTDGTATTLDAVLDNAAQNGALGYLPSEQNIPATGSPPPAPDQALKDEYFKRIDNPFSKEIVFLAPDALGNPIPAVLRLAPTSQIPAKEKISHILFDQNGDGTVDNTALVDNRFNIMRVMDEKAVDGSGRFLYGASQTDYRASVFVEGGYFTGTDDINTAADERTWVKSNFDTKTLLKMDKILLESIFGTDQRVDEAEYARIASGGLMEALNKAFAELGKSTFVSLDSHFKIERVLDPNTGRIIFKVQVTNEAKKIEPDFRVPEGITLTAEQRMELEELFAKCFKPDASAADFSKGYQKLQRELQKRDFPFIIDCWTPEIQSRLEQADSREAPIRMQLAAIQAFYDNPRKVFDENQRLIDAEILASGRTPGSADAEFALWEANLRSTYPAIKADLERQLAPSQQQRALYHLNDFAGSGFTSNGTFKMPVRVRPAFEDISVEVIQCDKNANPISGNNAEVTGTSLELDLPTLNQRGLGEAQKQVQEYYNERGFILVTEQKLSQMLESVPDMPDTSVDEAKPAVKAFVMNAIPAPKDGAIRGEGNIFADETAPDADTLAKWFDDENYEHMTNASMDRGLEKLYSWFADQGFMLKPRTNKEGEPCEIDIAFVDGFLVIKADALKLGEIKHKALDENGQIWLENNSDIISREMGLVGKNNGYINKYRFDEAIARLVGTMGSYNLQVQYAGIAYDEQGKPELNEDTNFANLEIVFNMKGSKNLNGGVGAGTAGLSLNGQYTSTDDRGRQFAANAGLTGLPKAPTFGAGASYTLPRHNDDNTVTFMGNTNYSPLDRYNGQYAGLEYKAPIGDSNSNISFLFGGGIERIAHEGFSNVGDIGPRIYVGAEVTDDGWILNTTVGPRASFNGGIYVEATVSATKVEVLGKAEPGKERKWYSKTKAEAGIRYGVDGYNPMDLASTNMTQNFMGIPGLSVYGRVKSGLFYTVAPGVGLGLGLGATLSNPFAAGLPSIGGGLMIDTQGQVATDMLMIGGGISMVGQPCFILM